MHYSNYISAREAKSSIRDEVKEITLTPTARKQTREKTLEALKKNGIKVREVTTSGRPRRLAGDKIRKILAIRESGISFNKIANLTSVPKSTIFDYCNRHEGPAVESGEIRALEIQEAQKVFAELLDRDLDEEISELASRGQKAEDPEEIGDILREIEIILHC